MLGSLLKIYYWDFFILLIGNIGKVEPHSHNASQVFNNIKGSHRIRVNNKILTSNIIYIEKNTEHEVLGSDKHQISILIDADSIIAKHISHKFLDNKRYSTDKNLLEYFQFEDPIKFKTNIANILIDDNCINCNKYDSRIVEVKELIKKDIEKKLTLPYLADKISLSESRLAHLFKSEVGVPIRKYLLWKRLFSGFNIILEGKSLTTAAYDAGFSDSAHLCRSFRTNFGLNLSKIFKNSKFIKFYNLD